VDVHQRWTGILGECMGLSIIDIDNGIKDPTVGGYQNCNTTIGKYSYLMSMSRWLTLCILELLQGSISY
jgi:hypothetical protein